MFILIFKDSNVVISSDFFFMKQNKSLPYSDDVLDKYAKDLFYHTDIEPNYDLLNEDTILEFDKGNQTWKYLQDIEIVRSKKLQALKEYDSSPAVNSFYLFGNAMWLPKELRISLSNTAWSKDRMKIQRMPVNLQNNSLILDVEQVLDILSEVEDYANLCFVNTDKHRIAIEQFEKIQEIENYNFKTGYPNKLYLMPVVYESLIDNE